MSDPGWLFRVTTVVTLVGGAVFLMWLCEQMTLRGIGSGVSLIIVAGILAQLPSWISGTLELGRQGTLSTGSILVVPVVAVLVMAFVVLMERARRQLLVQYPKRRAGSQMFEDQSSRLPLKLNVSGVMPAIAAASLLLLPTAVAIFNAGQGPDWLVTITSPHGYSRPLFLILYVALLAFLAFLCTAIVFSPSEIAANLKKQGGFIPGIAPGGHTAEYVQYVLSRITVVAAFCLTLICLLPELLTFYASVPFYFGGTCILIVTVATLELVGMVENTLLHE